MTFKSPIIFSALTNIILDGQNIFFFEYFFLMEQFKFWNKPWRFRAWVEITSNNFWILKIKKIVFRKAAKSSRQDDIEHWHSKSENSFNKLFDDFHQLLQTDVHIKSDNSFVIPETEIEVLSNKMTFKAKTGLFSKTKHTQNIVKELNTKRKLLWFNVSHLIVSLTMTKNNKR